MPGTYKTRAKSKPPRKVKQIQCCTACETAGHKSTGRCPFKDDPEGLAIFLADKRRMESKSACNELSDYGPDKVGCQHNMGYENARGYGGKRRTDTVLVDMPHTSSSTANTTTLSQDIAVSAFLAKPEGKDKGRQSPDTFSTLSADEKKTRMSLDRRFTALATEHLQLGALLSSTPNVSSPSPSTTTPPSLLRRRKRPRSRSRSRSAAAAALAERDAAAAAPPHPTAGPPAIPLPPSPHPSLSRPPTALSLLLAIAARARARVPRAPPPGALSSFSVSSTSPSTTSPPSPPSSPSYRWRRPGSERRLRHV